MDALLAISAKVLNTSLLIVAALALVVMFDHMDRKTRNSIRFATLIMFVGVVAQGIGVWIDWKNWTDTLLFGGIAAFLIANVRRPFALVCKGKPQEYVSKVADSVSLGVCAMTIFAVVAFW